ncbi:hypothetical protein MESS2_1590082 [Mesorhizobium metallidurans STM 2683]|uniref:Uncharacterized protein n=1 Tax=Mesorhizobium metallidurans STM 2683 TaxID=1297569 RepID=M5EN19_9HYPH|nr:hypothetical protein MESS2_1590082 [Mesorhizobium metallidurans STM 2683]
MISRRDHFGGRPSRDGDGMTGSRTAHSISVKSLEYRSPLRACFARVISVHMCLSVDASQHRLNHKSLISLNSFSGQTAAVKSAHIGRADPQIEKGRTVKSGQE